MTPVNERLELIVRPFLRWLDHNAETLMTDALKEVEVQIRVNSYIPIPIAVTPCCLASIHSRSVKKPCP